MSCTAPSGFRGLLRSWREAITWNVALVMVVVFSGGFSYSYVLWLVPLLVGETVEVGAWYSIAFLAAAVAGLVAGSACDALGRKPVAVAASTLMVVSAAAMWAGLYHLAPTGFFVSSVLAYPSLASLVAESSGKPERAYGVVEVARTAGYLVGPFVGALLLTTLGLGACLAAPVAACLVSFLASVLIRETLRRRGWQWRGLRVVEVLHGLRSVWELMAYFLLTGFFEAMITPFISPILRDSGLTEAQIGFLYSACSAAALASTPLASHAVERMGALRSLTLSCALAAAVYTGLWASRSPLPSSIIVVVGCTATPFFTVAFPTLVSSLAPKEVRGRAFSAFQVLNDLLSWPAPGLGGLIYPHCFLACGASYVVGALLLLRLEARLRASSER